MAFKDQLDKVLHSSQSVLTKAHISLQEDSSQPISGWVYSSNRPFFLTLETI